MSDATMVYFIRGLMLGALIGLALIIIVLALGVK